MTTITQEQLAAYLDDALGETESAQVEQALRLYPKLVEQLRTMMQQRDRGEHSVGAIWRRQRLSCPTREQIGSFLLGVLEPDHQAYIDFHLKTIGCPFCLANHADLKAQQQSATAQVQERRQRFFESSRSLLPTGK